jgi:hypothetical protein
LLLIETIELGSGVSQRRWPSLGAKATRLNLAASRPWTRITERPLRRTPPVFTATGLDQVAFSVDMSSAVIRSPSVNSTSGTEPSSTVRYSG